MLIFLLLLPLPGRAGWRLGIGLLLVVFFSGMDIVDEIVAQAKNTDENGMVDDGVRVLIDSITVAPAAAARASASVSSYSAARCITISG